MSSASARVALNLFDLLEALATVSDITVRRSPVE